MHRPKHTLGTFGLGPSVSAGLAGSMLDAGWTDGWDDRLMKKTWQQNHHSEENRSAEAYNIFNWLRYNNIHSLTNPHMSGPNKVGTRF